ncbi:hypothetical protein [Streptomyces sp. NPDC052496]|uniref:hypothetical protein n=1 Tax=Streptomyces sp. NPDC052496 TaxID=3154951 RepID=UPI00342A6D77
MSAPPAEHAHVLIDHTGAPRPLFFTPQSLDDARLGMAVHEAGHAVLALLYGLRVETTEIIQWTGEDGDWFLTGQTAVNGRRICPWDLAAYMAAGEVAHLKHLAGLGWTREQAEAIATADHDREDAVATLARHGFRLGRDHAPHGGRSWASIQAQALDAVDAVWEQITTVARAIAADTKLHGDTVAALVGLPNPESIGGVS